jgi:hypothetical protein
MILNAFASLNAWGWIAFAAILLVAEILVPGYFLIWIGAAAAITGVIFLIVPGAAWQIQTGVFALLAILSVLAWVRFARGRQDAPTDQPNLNLRTQALIGQHFVLEEPIQAGRGRVRIADSVWVVSGPDCASGTRVTVRAVDGATLVVTPA